MGRDVSTQPKVIQVPSFADAAVGDIGLLFGTSLISRVIEWGEGLAHEGSRPPSHAFLIYRPAAPLLNFPGLIYESRWPRVSLRPMSEYAAQRVELYRLMAPTAAVKQEALDAMVGMYLSRPYGLRTVSAMAVIEPLRALGIPVLRNYLQQKDDVFCSQMADSYIRLVYAKSAMNPGALPPPALCDPANLRQWLKELT